MTDREQATIEEVNAIELSDDAVVFLTALVGIAGENGFDREKLGLIVRTVIFYNELMTSPLKTASIENIRDLSNIDKIRATIQATNIMNVGLLNEELKVSD